MSSSLNYIKIPGAIFTDAKYVTRDRVSSKTTYSSRFSPCLVQMFTGAEITDAKPRIIDPDLYQRRHFHLDLCLSRSNDLDEQICFLIDHTYSKNKVSGINEAVINSRIKVKNVFALYMQGK